MAKVTGIGGVFFKTADREAMRGFFSDQLGVPTEAWGAVFPWRERHDPEVKGATVLGLFDASSDYFGPAKVPFMLNLRVDDLGALIVKLREAGVPVVREISQEPNGKFAHIQGPEGIVIELWEPVNPDPYDP